MVVLSIPCRCARGTLNLHPRYQHSLEDLFVHVYVFVDDWLKENEERLGWPRQPRQVASYGELFMIAVVGELRAQPYESIWYRLVGQSCRALFPRLPEYSRYHRVVRNAEALWAALALELGCTSAGKLSIIDAKPLPVAKGKRTS